ncbi:MAG: thioredoxin family protein [Candidatus Bipolaricaulota bacterium]|nr:thioredoxin family protein [Candidatus Bipolaricaulota bacterium]
MGQMRGFHRELASYGAMGAAIVALCLALLFVAVGCSKPSATAAPSAANLPKSATPGETTAVGAPASQTTVPASAEVVVMPVLGGAPSVAPAVDSAPGGPAGQLPATQTAASAVSGTVRLPRLVDLGAGKCIPCKKMAPILEELAETHKAFFSVEVIDVWVNPDQGKEYNVRIIPTQIFYDAQGRELYRHVGFYSKEEILSKWRQLGVNVGS